MEAAKKSANGAAQQETVVSAEEMPETASAPTTGKRRKTGQNIRTRGKAKENLTVQAGNQQLVIYKGRAATHALVNENEYNQSASNGVRLPERNLIHLKLMNALLYFAGNQLTDMSVHMHYAPLHRICELIGFNSNNMSEIKDGLRELMQIAVEWDGYDNEGLPNWGRANLMSEVGMVGKNMCRFAFPPILRSASANPTVFARINLALQSSFSSKHSLALYEFCRTYVDQKKTPVREIDDFKRMFGVFSTQASWQYGVFKRDILKRAIADVNKVSDIRISLIETRIRTQVTHVQFTVEEIVAAAGGVVEFTAQQTELIDLLMRHGLSDKNAQESVLSHPPEAIRAAVRKTQAAQHSGQLSKELTGRYLLRLLISRSRQLRPPADTPQLALSLEPRPVTRGKEEV